MITPPAMPQGFSPLGAELPPERFAAIQKVAEELEAGFLSEMLKHSGVATPSETMGGGAGETAFAGFLSDAYAAELAKIGGLGLSEHVVAALIAREGG